MLINERRLNMMNAEDRKFRSRNGQIFAGEEYAQAGWYKITSAYARPSTTACAKQFY